MGSLAYKIGAYMSRESRSTRYVVSINQILAHRGYFDTLKNVHLSQLSNNGFYAKNLGIVVDRDIFIQMQ